MPEGALHDWIVSAAAAVLGAAAAFLFFLRRVMTKNEHADICRVNGKLIEQKIKNVETKLEGVEKRQDEQHDLLVRIDGKLDRLAEK